MASQNHIIFCKIGVVCEIATASIGYKTLKDENFVFKYYMYYTDSRETKRKEKYVRSFSEERKKHKTNKLKFARDTMAKSVR